VLLELRFEQCKRERAPVDRTIDAAHHVDDGTNVIFVSVGQDERLDAPAPGVERRQIRNHQIDAEQLGFRKHDAGIHHDSRVPAGDEQHVHAELADPAKGNHVNRRRRGAIRKRQQNGTSSGHDGRANGYSQTVIHHGAGAPTAWRCVRPIRGRWEDPKTGWKTGRNYSTRGIVR